MGGLQRLGYASLARDEWVRPQVEGEAELLACWSDLQPDRFMGDGGSYRLRRFSRFRWRPGAERLQCLDDSSIFQTRADNSLNGGQLRRFEPLTPEAARNPFLLALVAADAARLELPERDWNVGVHCVRILARPGEAGLPTPEGIHRDAELWTVQHMIERHQVTGGTFSAYDEERRPCFHWKQLQLWDTLFFGGNLWHSATPVYSSAGGHRSILLVDFDPV